MNSLYRILNIDNGYAYYGVSLKPSKRFTTHRNLLRRGKHHNPKLQKDWVKMGSTAFIFEVISRDVPNRTEAETKAIEAHGLKVYNIANPSGDKHDNPIQHRLNELLIEKELTQTGFSKLTGIAKQHINVWCNGGAISIKNAYKIKECLKLNSIDDLYII